MAMHTSVKRIIPPRPEMGCVHGKSANPGSVPLAFIVPHANIVLIGSKDNRRFDLENVRPLRARRPSWLVGSPGY
jgi:hypothetical protein